MEKKIIFAKEIVKKYKIPYHTLNYYTTIGLFPILSKVGNVRTYNEDQVKKRLAIISRLSREGYPLNLIRKKITGFLKR